MANSASKEKREKTNYHLTAHEYIMIEYFRREDFRKFEEILKANTGQYTNAEGKVDYEKLARFFIHNIDIFVSMEIINDVVRRAIELFSLNLKFDELNPVSDQNIKAFLDVDKKFGGINIMKFSFEESIKELHSLIYPLRIRKFLYTHEVEHYEKLMRTESIDELLNHVEFGLNGMENSGTYRYILEFAKNTCLFYLSGDLPLDERKNRASIIGNYAKKDIAGGVAGAIIGSIVPGAGTAVGAAAGAAANSWTYLVEEIIDRIVE